METEKAMPTTTEEIDAQITALQAELAALPAQQHAALNAGDAKAWTELEWKRQRLPVEIHGLRVRRKEAEIEGYRVEARDLAAKREELLPAFHKAKAEAEAATNRQRELSEQIRQYDDTYLQGMLRQAARELEQLRNPQPGPTVVQSHIDQPPDPTPTSAATWRPDPEIRRAQEAHR